MPSILVQLAKLFIAPTLVVLLLICNFGCSRSLLQKAEELAKSGQIDQSIALYRQHMQKRIDDKSRPDWENPYFYEIVIGDLELERGDLDLALDHYAKAHENGVEDKLVGDRIRSAAAQLEESGKIDQAFQLLEKNRALDPLLFDVVLDRIAKTAFGGVGDRTQ